jgi:hypothetical protein
MFIKMWFNNFNFNFFLFFLLLFLFIFFFFSFVYLSVEDPTNYNARASLCLAATLALSGYQRTGLSTDWNVHKLEKAIPAYNTDLAHGEGLE